jgi:hypothetical protein
MLTLLLPTRRVQTRRDDMRASPPLNEILLHRNGEKPVRSVDKVISEAQLRRHVLYAAFAGCQRIFSGLPTESVLAAAMEAAGGITDELSDHGGGASGSFDKFYGGDEGVFFNDDSAVGADGRAGGA